MLEEKTRNHFSQLKYCSSMICKEFLPYVNKICKLFLPCICASSNFMKSFLPSKYSSCKIFKEFLPCLHASSNYFDISFSLSFSSLTFQLIRQFLWCPQFILLLCFVRWEFYVWNVNNAACCCLCQYCKQTAELGSTLDLLNASRVMLITTNTDNACNFYKIILQI